MSSDSFPGSAPGNAVGMAAFERDGFLLRPAFLSADEVAECLLQLERYIADVVPGLSPEEVFYEERENPETLKQLQSMHVHDRWFGDFFGGRVRQLAEELLSGEVVGRNMQFFNKPPGIGRPTPPHQDGYYFKIDPPSAVTMWLALDEADEDNGCVRYVKASHRKGMRPHTLTDTLGFSQEISDFGTSEDEENEVAVTAAPGDLLAHHALTIHRADRNCSARRNRRALGCIFYSVEAMEDLAAEADYRRQLAGQQRGRI
ncbi:MAG: phytanoyl-CoA dioxygenase family protein [Verrucomicrobiales bacterium]